ncbi:MAG: hypothetical protein CFE39_03560 [Comamonadaceae bacterium PBBC2]|nr:MAG: hypothetical protein CFE39_03560 [Comamonadaceae bacterium PBBC2]
MWVTSAVISRWPTKCLRTLIVIAVALATIGGAQSTGSMQTSPIGQPPAESDFVAKTRDLLQLLVRHPAQDHEPFWSVGGIDMHPVSSISARSLQVLRSEASAYDPSARDRALRCGVPADLPAQYQVLVLDLNVAAFVPVPVFLGPKAKELRYVEVALHRPELPLVVLVTGYDGFALRLSTSPETDLVAVHMQTYYPGIVLGVPAAKVTQTYLPRNARNGAANSSCAYSDTKAQDIAAGLGLRPTETEVLRAEGNDNRLVYPKVAIAKRQPLLGAFLDLEMPVPSQYGLAVLADKGYLRPALSAQQHGGGNQVLEVLKPFRLPEGLHGSHLRTFLLPKGVRQPSGDLGHSTLIREP